MPSIFAELARSITHLALPQLCEGCRVPLHFREQVLCMGCTLQLPQTGFHDIPENDAAMRLVGRVPYAHATAFGYFTPDGLLQHLLHRLKYKGRKQAGIFLGQQAGYSLKNSSWISTIDAIIPVPLHPKKQASRGFNQTAIIAQGLGEVLGIPVFDRALVRTRHTESQTKKSREERISNVKDAFVLSPKINMQLRHALLIDDVLTTGATLEAASVPLLTIPDMRLSILTIGLAMI